LHEDHLDGEDEQEEEDDESRMTFGRNNLIPKDREMNKMNPKELNNPSDSI